MSTYPGAKPPVGIIYNFTRKEKKQMKKFRAASRDKESEMAATRVFGKDITNSSRLRPQFVEKDGETNAALITPRKTPQKTQSPRRRLQFNDPTSIRKPVERQIHKPEQRSKRGGVIVFNERRSEWTQDGRGKSIDFPPPSKKNKTVVPSSGSLLRTRCQELQTLPEEPKDNLSTTINLHDLGECYTWNEETKMSDDWIIINPHSLSLTNVKSVEYASKVLTAVPLHG